MVFFEREQKSLAVTQNASDYRAGDVVVWDLAGGVLHMGLVTDSHSTDTNRLLLVHNLSAGARLEDVLFAWKIVGHYRYF